MRVCVLSLTRDRLDYTKHCFAQLEAKAGCAYDHYVLDNGSTDGTADWLDEWFSRGRHWYETSGENIGISRGLNCLLGVADTFGPYDVFVKVDNDCEVVTDGAIATAALAAMQTGWIVSPTVEGLRNQVPTIRYHRPEKSPHVLRETAMVGGLCMAIPAAALKGWRFPEDNPVWGGDDTGLCAHHRAQGGHTGYLVGYTVNHYETTDGQHERYPDYFLRRMLEGGPA